MLFAIARTAFIEREIWVIAEVGRPLAVRLEVYFGDVSFAKRSGDLWLGVVH